MAIVGRSSFALVLLAALQLSPGAPAAVAQTSAEPVVVDANRAIAAALAQRKAGQFEQAFATLKTLVETDARNARGHHELATLYAIHGQFVQAARHFQIALQLEPKRSVAQRNLAEVLRADGRHAAALKHYQALAGNAEAQAAALRGVALCQEALGQIGAARTALQALVKNHGATKIGRWARGHLRDLTEQQSQGKVTAAHADGEGKRLFDEGRYDSAEAWFAYALRAQPSADRAFRLGIGRLAQRDYLGAVAALQQALSLAPGHKPAMSAYPTALRKLRSVGGGGQEVALASEDAGTPMRRAAQALLRGELLLAGQIAKAAEKGRYKGLVLQLLAAEAQLRSGSLAGAERTLRKVIETQAGHPVAVAALAEVLYRRGHHSDARRMAGLATPPRDPAVRGLPVADLEQYVRWRRGYVDAQLAMAVDPLRRPAAPFRLQDGLDPESMIPGSAPAGSK